MSRYGPVLDPLASLDPAELSAMLPPATVAANRVFLGPPGDDQAVSNELLAAVDDICVAIKRIRGSLLDTRPFWSDNARFLHGIHDAGLSLAQLSIRHRLRLETLVTIDIPAARSLIATLSH